MIKKLLTAGLILSGLVTVNAQSKLIANEMPGDGTRNITADNTIQVANKTAVANVQDTLYYFLRKHTFEATTPNSFPTLPAPYPSTVNLNEFGVSFLNPNNESILVTGAVVFAGIKAGSTSTMIPVTVTLYTASPAGVPGASVATATCAVTGVTNTVGYSSFATFTTPVTANGAYFIAYRAVPSAPADTLLVAFARGFTPTSTVAVNDRFGDGLGYIKAGTNFGVTTGAFGTGTDYEPIVVPFASFSYTADATQSAATSTIAGKYCAHLGITYSNTTTGLIKNRQYNYNEFASYWKYPYQNTYSWTPVPDSVYNWTFNGPATPTASYYTGNVTHTYATTGTVSAGLIIKYQKHTKTKAVDLKNWPLEIVDCGLVGVGENSLNSELSVYPNPMINGKTSIKGLEGKNSIIVYNLLGQVVSTETTEAEIVTVDLSSQAPGTYMIRITDASNHSKVVKVINE